jgi:hypothetical protein
MNFQELHRLTRHIWFHYTPPKLLRNLRYTGTLADIFFKNTQGMLHFHSRLAPFGAPNTEYAVLLPLVATPIFASGRPSGILYRWQTSYIMEH